MWASVRSYCPYCGARAEAGDRFCRRCGTALDPPASEPERAPARPAPRERPARSAERPAAPDPRPRRRAGRAAAAVAVVVAGVAVGALVLGRGASDPAEVPSPPADIGARGGQAAPVAPPDPGLCGRRGIDPLMRGSRSGHCHTGDGTRLTVADQSGRLRMKTLDVRFASVRQATSVTAAGGFSTQNAHGTYVVINVSITNRLRRSAGVDQAGAQTALLLDDGKRYDENYPAQDLADASSFAARMQPLQPDETASGDFIFDLPARALRRFDRRGGALVIAELGDDLGSARRYGVLRLRPPVR